MKYLSDWQVSMTVLVIIFKYILYSKDREDVNLVSTTIEFYEEESICTDVSLFCKSECSRKCTCFVYIYNFHVTCNIIESDC